MVLICTVGMKGMVRMKKIRLENTTGNHSKYYEMEEQTGNEFVAQWGRISASNGFPAQKVYSMSDWDDILNKKISKGYVVMPQPKKPAKRKPSKRLVDVLDDTLVDKEFWNKMFAKMNQLLVAIESHKGPSMSIDDTEYRWVSDRVEYWNSEGRILTKEEMTIANHYWKRYGK